MFRRRVKLLQKMHSRYNQQIRSSERGENASFTCSVPNFTPKIDSVTWDIVDDIYHKYFEEQYAESTHVFTSTVVVHNDGDETQFFRCTLRRGSSGCYFSRRARTIVQHFPTQNEVKCQPQSPMAFEIGDSTTIECSAPRGKPAVDMAFVSEKRMPFSIHQPRVVETRATRTIVQDLTFTADMHFTNITCRVTSQSVFPDLALHCPIGPFIVYQTPRVRVEPSAVAVQHLDDVISVLCIAKGYPDVFSFSWACFPQEYFEGCSTRSNELNLKINCSVASNPQDIEVTITCSATNSRGLAYNTSRIMIHSSVWNQCKRRITTTTSHTEQIGSYLRLEQNYASYTGNQQLMVQVACVFVSPIENIRLLDLDLDCHFGQQILKPDATEKYVEFVFTFTIQDISSFKTIPKVTCRANTTLGLYEQEMNITLNHLPFVTGSVPILTTNVEDTDNTANVVNWFEKYKFVLVVVGATVLIALLFICAIAVIYSLLHYRFEKWTGQTLESKSSEVNIPEEVNCKDRDDENLGTISYSAYEVPMAAVSNDETQAQSQDNVTTMFCEIYSSCSDSQSEESISSGYSVR